MCRVFYIVDSAEKVRLTINDVWTEYMAGRIWLHPKHQLTNKRSISTRPVWVITRNGAREVWAVVVIVTVWWRSDP